MLLCIQKLNKQLLLRIRNEPHRSLFSSVIYALCCINLTQTLGLLLKLAALLLTILSPPSEPNGNRRLNRGIVCITFMAVWPFSPASLFQRSQPRRQLSPRLRLRRRAHASRTPAQASALRPRPPLLDITLVGHRRRDRRQRSRVGGGQQLRDRLDPPGCERHGRPAERR